MRATSLLLLGCGITAGQRRNLGRQHRVAQHLLHQYSPRYPRTACAGGRRFRFQPHLRHAGIVAGRGRGRRSHDAGFETPAAWAGLRTCQPPVGDGRLRTSSSGLVASPSFRGRTPLPDGGGKGAHPVHSGPLCLSRLGYQSLAHPPRRLALLRRQGRSRTPHRRTAADYALRKIPTRSFEANALYLEIIRLADNLVTAFQHLCLQDRGEP